jgi:acyl carrier protein
MKNEDPMAMMSSQAASELEQALARIWAETLGHDTVGVHDDFFDLGGHSLLAIEIALKIKKLLGLAVEASDVARLRTVTKLAAAIARALAEHAGPEAVAELAVVPEKLGTP